MNSNCTLSKETTDTGDEKVVTLIIWGVVAACCVGLVVYTLKK